MISDKINQFSEGKYTLDVPAAQIVAEFEEKRGDTATVVEALSITQRFVSTCKQLHPILPNRLRDLIKPPFLATQRLSQTCQPAPIDIHWNNNRYRPLSIDGLVVHDEHFLKEDASSPTRSSRL